MRGVRLKAGMLVLLLGCGSPPAVRVTGSEELGVVAQSNLILGRDGAASALLWGRSVWVFGDTVTRVPDVEGQTWHSNSFSITADLDAMDGVGGLTESTDDAGAPVYLLAPTADEEAFIVAHRGDPCAEQPCGARYAAWPGAPVFDARRDRALVPYGLVWAAPGDFNFHGVGQSFAVWNGLSQAPERPLVSPGAAFPTMLFGETEPNFGTASVIDGDELLAFGCVLDWLTFHCSLAKVGLDQVFDRSAWRFWDGTRWSPSMADARPVLDATSDLTVQFNPHFGVWMAIYSGIFSNDVLIRTAPALTGPWSDEGTLVVADRKGQSGTSYDAQPHAEYARDGGRVIFVTYTRPTGEGWFGSEVALVQVTLD
jgi:hypothetical protein